MSDIYGQLGIDPSIAPQPNAGLLTYLRGIGLDLATIREDKQRRLADIAAAKIRQDQQIAEAKTRVDRSSTGNLASRGVTRSGEADRQYAENTKAMLDAYGQSAADTATATADAERAAKAGEMGITRSATEYLLGMSEEQQRAAAQRQAEMENANAITAAMREGNDAYLAMLREQQTATANEPIRNPYATAETQVNRETYAGLPAAPPEGNYNLGFYPTVTGSPGSSLPISPGYPGPLRRPAAPNRTTTNRAV